MTSHEEAVSSDSEDSDSCNCSRRGFLGTGFGVGLAMATTASVLSACSSADPAPASGMLFLRDEDVALFHALLPVVAIDLMDLAPDTRHKRVTQTVRQIDQACAAMNLLGHNELRRLFGLLSMPVLRWLATGVRAAWREATPQQIAGFLERWRTGRLETLRAGRNALVKLCSANYFALPESRSVSGYPGPQPGLVLALNG